MWEYWWNFRLCLTKVVCALYLYLVKIMIIVTGAFLNDQMTSKIFFRLWITSIKVICGEMKLIFSHPHSFLLISATTSQS